MTMTVLEVTNAISSLKGQLALCQNSDPRRARVLARNIDELLALRSSLIRNQQLRHAETETSES